MPQTQLITLYSYRGEDEGGYARYHVRVYEAMYEEHAAKKEERDGIPRASYISGFLFPRDAEFRKNAREYGKIHLTVGRDFLTAGDTSSALTPREAAESGHTVYRIEGAAQPPRFSDGMLSEWCHFEGKTERARYA